MTRERRAEIFRRSFEAMEGAQEIVDAEQRVVVRTLAQIVYELAWCVWQMIIDDKRRARKSDQGLSD